MTWEVEKFDAYSRVTVTESKDAASGASWTFRLQPVQIEGETSRNPSESPFESTTCVVNVLTDPGQAKPPGAKTTKPPTGVAGDLFKVIRRAVEEAGSIAFGRGGCGARA